MVPIQPLGCARYKVQFTASESLREKLERLRVLMRPEVPDGDLAAIVDRLVTHKLERIEARRFAMGGGHNVKNIGLVCRTHNAYLAELDYGREAMGRHRASAKAPGLNKRPAG